MLRVLRENSQSFIIYLIFVPIIIVFAVTFGPGSSSCQGTGSEYAAIVDGEVIAKRQFDLRYDQRVRALRQQMQGMELTDQMLERMGLKQQIIDQLINQELLAAEADRLDLYVSDDDLLEFLQSTYGVDDVEYDTYAGWVRSTFQMSVPQFESHARRQILGQKVAQTVTDSIEISDDELWRQYQREHDRIMFAAVKFDVAPADASEPDADAVDALLEEDEEAVKAYYEENQFKYRTPKRVKARQIVLELPSGADEAKQEAVRGELLELKAQLEQGATFAELAQKHSQDSATAEKGGDLGFVQRGMLAPALEKQIFALDAGEVADEPVKTRQGLHLVKVETIEPPGRKAFSNVKRDAARALLRQQQAERKAREQARAMLEQLRSEQASLEELTMTQSEKEEAETPPDKPVRWESPWVLRSQEALPRIGVQPDIKEALFGLSTDAPWPQEVFKAGKAFYVFKLTDKEIPVREKFEEKKEDLREEAVFTKQNEVLEAWLQHLRSEAEVKLNPNLFPPESETPAAPSKAS